MRRYQSSRRATFAIPKQKVEVGKTIFEEAAKSIGLISAIAVSVAVSYDVGYFSAFDINMFTLFSLSEHILFSLSVIPVCLAIGAVVNCYIVLAYGLRRFLPRFRIIGIRSVVGVATIFITFIISAVWFFGFLEKLYFITAIFFFVSVGAAFLVELPRRYFGPVITFSLFSFVLWVSYLFGRFASERYFDLSILDTNNITSAEDAGNQRDKKYFIELKSDTNNSANMELRGKYIKAYLLRSGEKGVLYYDFESKNVSYLLWEGIRSIKLHKKAFEVSPYPGKSRPADKADTSGLGSGTPLKRED